MSNNPPNVPPSSGPTPNFNTHIPSLANEFPTPADNDEHAAYYKSLQGGTQSRGRMKALFIGILIICGFFGWRRWHSSGAMAAWQGSWETGVDQSQAAKKPQLVLFTADWCPACNHFEEQVLSHKEVTDKLQEKYILTKVDLTERNGPNAEIARDFGVKVIPSLFIVAPDGSRSPPLTGSVSAARLEQWLNSAKLSKIR